jgi:hypothetical protein
MTDMMKEGRTYLMPSRQLAVCVWSSESQASFRYSDGEEVTLTESFCRRNLQLWTLTNKGA